jgi:pseudaminic acid cytidylyltransferase
MKIAVIPARGGSKLIPRQNIKPLHGKLMISYAISAAIATGVFVLVVATLGLPRTPHGFTLISACFGDH